MGTGREVHKFCNIYLTCIDFETLMELLMTMSSRWSDDESEIHGVVRARDKDLGVISLKTVMQG